MGVLAQVAADLAILKPSAADGDTSIPAATIPLIIITIALPKNFPHQYAGRQSRRHGLFSMMRRLDPLGAILFLGLSIMLVAALQGAGITWAWSSPASICLFIFASISTICFIFWERFISLHRKDTVPVLTWEFATRKCLGMFMYGSLIHDCSLVLTQGLMSTHEGVSFWSALH